MFQSFQRIQRNRQSRIRLKLSRRAGRRQDEVLEEEEENGVGAEVEDHIDIVGETTEGGTKMVEVKKGERKSVKRGGCYGPEQFTEEDVQAGAVEGEQEVEEGDHDQSRRCSQCQASNLCSSVFSTPCPGLIRQHFYA